VDGCPYDKCWPERWNSAARHEVENAVAPQMHNGHVLDQTVWNWQFEPGTDKLTPAGMDHLACIARRRPYPDPKVYVQVAQDVPYDPAKPEDFTQARQELNLHRKIAVEKFLLACTGGKGAFLVDFHDPGERGMFAVPMGISVQRNFMAFQGFLPGGGMGAGGMAGGAGVGAGAGAANVSGGAGALPGR
ncbi:MAG TPA: hypothetical protein VFA26_17215, partial [Gemmataceae bacterium]|nr:hypothetical protein [Gemmataceae bacterium]